ncbi:chemotaxis protein CheB [Laspinema sp. D1]|uniref:chemotaxis protein CheB n=1 Tax=Laspinema palackyanum TaxID=3231601 RepID=UPI003488EAF6|nr:chemotaxis protein CheB [Laspinema sp. D2b]
MSISKNKEKAAQKILCIGGSTLNEGTIEKIKDALIETDFLQEWAVIFVNHLYFKIEEIQEYKNKIQQEWQGVNIDFVDQIGNHKININIVYILPDPSSVKDEEKMVKKEEFRSADCIEQNGQVMLQVLQPQSSLDQLNQWWVKRLNDAGENQRPYMPCIDKFMQELADVKTNIKNLTIAGLILCGRDGDGADGLKAIKNEGGKTAVQNPDECQGKSRLNINTNEYPDKTTCSMPYTALDKEPKHQTISIEGNSNFTSLTDWLKEIF